MLMPSIFGENLFDDFFTPFYYDDKDEKKAEKKLYGRRAQNLLKTDIKEKPEGYELIVDVPGFKKDEVKVALKDGYLTVSAAKNVLFTLRLGSIWKDVRMSSECMLVKMKVPSSGSPS